MTRRADAGRVSGVRIPAVLDAFTWGVGVAGGVAIGAYLTAVGGTGAPGVEGIDTTETLMLPLMAGSAVFCLVLGIRVLAALLRTAAHPPRGDHRDGEQGEDHRVTGQVH